MQVFPFDANASAPENFRGKLKMYNTRNLYAQTWHFHSLEFFADSLQHKWSGATVPTHTQDSPSSLSIMLSSSSPSLNFFFAIAEDSYTIFSCLSSRGVIVTSPSSISSVYMMITSDYSNSLTFKRCSCLFLHFVKKPLECKAVLLLLHGCYSHRLNLVIKKYILQSDRWEH